MTSHGADGEPEAFVENVPLTDVFGTHPKTKILGVLLTVDEDPPTHFSVNEIVRISGLDDETVVDNVRDLERQGIVVETDELEDAATFTLAPDSDVVADIRELYADLF